LTATQGAACSNKNFVFAILCFCLNLQTKEYEVLHALNYKIKFSPHIAYIRYPFFLSDMPTFFFPYLFPFFSYFFSFIILYLFFISVLFVSFLFLAFLCLSAVGLYIFSKCLFHFSSSRLIGPYVDLVLTANRFSYSDDNIVEPKFQLIHSSTCLLL
jgi:hypothetical protein